MPATEDEPPVELTVSLEKIRDIVLRAREFDLEDIADDPDPGEDSDADIDREALLDEGEDSTEIELRELIDDLNDDEIVDLIALVWVGRGDFGREEWQEARALARDRRQAKSSTYLMGMPTLADYIEEGLSTLGHSPDSLEDI